MTSENSPSVDFAPGSACLLLNPLSVGAAAALTTDPILRRYLTLSRMVIPPEHSKSIEPSTRRNHCYTFKDLLARIVKKGAGQNHLDQAFIDALEDMAKERLWAAPTLGSKAEDLFGCLLRMDQYCDLEPTDLSTTGSFWKDATKGWLRRTVGHTPTRAEVSPAAMKALLENKEISLQTRALLTACWHTTGRPYNWLYVEKSDVKLKLEDRAEKEEEAKRKGVPMKPLGYSLQVLWKQHKTLGMTCQAHTTHSWISPQVGAEFKRWYDAVQGQWLFPKGDWANVKLRLAAALKTQDPSWDLKALRRGSLSTMARAGVPLQDLMLLSFHKSTATALRYLGWGAAARDLAVRGEDATRHLLPYQVVDVKTGTPTA
jgi:hypothetical protein